MAIGCFASIGDIVNGAIIKGIITESKIHDVYSVDIRTKYGLFGKRKIVEVLGADDYGILNITRDYKTGKILKQEEVHHMDGWTIPKRPDSKRKERPY